MASVRLGVAGWDHPNWLGAWYPEDMPTEWRLPFFNTQYGCVWLDRHAQDALDAVSLSAWLKDTRDDFVWLLEAPARVELQDLAAANPDRIRILAATDPSLLWFDAGTDLARLSASLLTPSLGERYVLSQDAHLARLEEVAQLLELLGL